MASGGGYEGRVADKPFAKIVYALAAQDFTGALVVEQEGRRYALWFDEGSIVDAESAAPEDQLGRVLLDANLIDRNAFAASLQKMAQDPRRDQLDVLVELKALGEETRGKAAILGLTRRALRVFGLPDGTFHTDDAEHSRAVGALDARWVIYKGLRQFYDVARLDRDLAPLSGYAIKMGPATEQLLDAYGFADEERIVLGYLQKGYWELPDLVDACIMLPRPVVMTVVYALIATDGLEIQPAESVARLRKRPKGVTQQLPMPAPTAAATKEMRVAPSAPLPSVAPPAPAASAAQVRPPPTVPPQQTGGSPQVREQIMKKFAAIEAGADHFAALEVDRAATKEQVKAAYFLHAKTFHPDRLALLKLEDLRPKVERIFSRLSESFAVLGDDAKRRDYMAILAQGGEAAVKKKQDAETAAAMKILSAEEHFRLGEMALRRNLWPQATEEFKKALDANVEEPEHHAYYAWCLWGSASDKKTVAADVKKRLQKAIEMSAQCAPAWFFLGQVAVFQGEADRAYGHFQKVVNLVPDHTDAQRELRVLQMRRKKK